MYINLRMFKFIQRETAKQTRLKDISNVNMHSIRSVVIAIAIIIVIIIILVIIIIVIAIVIVTEGDGVDEEDEKEGKGLVLKHFKWNIFLESLW